jgi:flagellar P-ring protein precursor FlgI
MHHCRFLVTALIALLALHALAPFAEARVRLESICTVYGQKEVKLTGMGLVVGLKGTGDGGKALPAMRALQRVLQNMNNPSTLPELQNAKNVAVVLVEATVPATGLRKGQEVDCFVSSFMGAKSLRGGRLLVTPLTRPALDERAYAAALASGPVFVEEEGQELTGKVPGGAVLEDNFQTPFVDDRNGLTVTLLLDAAHASFHSASEVARVVNAEFSFEAGYSELAKATAPGVVQVRIPEQYRDDHVRFVALLLAVGIDNPHTQARVVVNPKTGVIVVTGEVELSPVVIAHKNLTVQVGGDVLPEELPPSRFVQLDDLPADQAPQRLEELIEALNQLRVPTADVIAILRELHRTGKLHAVYEER